MFNLQLSIKNHWTDKIPDSAIIKRETNCKYGLIAPNVKVVPEAYHWCLAERAEAVEHIEDLTISAIADVCEAAEIICCIKELQGYDISLFSDISSISERFFSLGCKKEGSVPSSSPTLHQTLLRFYRDFDKGTLRGALAELADNSNKKMLFLSRVPWSIESELFPDGDWVGDQVKINIRARFVYKIIENNNIL